MSIACLIPAHNEVGRVGDTVRAVKKDLPVGEIIVIDDASTDATAEEARAAGADKVIVLDKNLGKGGALNRGLSATTADILLLLDADVGDSAIEAAKLLEPILMDAADMSIALLPKLKKKSGFGLVVRLAKWGIRWLGRLDVTTPLSGLRAVKREAVTHIGGFESGWGVEIALTVRAQRAGYRIVEVPTNFTHRVTGRSIGGFIQRGSQFAHVARFILREWRRRD